MPAAGDVAGCGKCAGAVVKVEKDLAGDVIVGKDKIERPITIEVAQSHL